MKSVEEIAAEIVMREGGYVDDPDEPGPKFFGFPDDVAHGRHHRHAVAAGL